MRRALGIAASTSWPYTIAPLADEDVGTRALRTPGVEDVNRRGRARLVNGARLQRRAVRGGVSRGEHLAARPVEKHGDLTRQDIGAGRSHRESIQPGHTDDGQARCERKSLDGREADAQPGERTRSQSHGEERHVAERQAARLERGERVAGQTHALRPRSVAGSTCTPCARQRRDGAPRSSTRIRSPPP